jgi:hypothetical protein
MAREDTRWFVVGVVVLAIVLFFALPMTVLIAIDNEKRLGRAEVRIDQKLKRLEKMETEVKAMSEALRNSQGD